MMATVRAKMYGEEESPFAHVGRDAAAMVNRVNELRKWASVIPDLTKLAKLKCPSNITNAVRNLPADVAGILSTGASNASCKFGCGCHGIVNVAVNFATISPSRQVHAH